MLKPPSHFESVSIVIPIYNELDTWKELLALVEASETLGLQKQIILVEDGSTDGTREQLQRFAKTVERESDAISYKVVFHDANKGKGAALRTGFENADGDIVIIQDADLEYDPSDYPRLLGPIVDGRSDAVYGTRLSQGRPPNMSRASYFANRFLTFLSNLTTHLSVTDMETCYKVIRRDVLKRLRIEQDRFGFEPEITAKIAHLGVRFCEVPIHYSPRTREEGKKIGWRDGLKAIWCILKYGVSKDRPIASD